MISGELPEELPSALTSLRVLRLSGNQITRLPETLGESIRLETLVLGSIFGGNLLQSFPEKCISRLVNLKELDLTQNQLASLPSDIGHPKSRLERLAVGENRLLSLPCSIGLCRSLRSLDLSRNRLLDLPIEITDLSGLETLDLTENKLCVIPGDIALFMSRTTVLLSGNPFTNGARRHDPTHEAGESTSQTNLSLMQQLQSTSSTAHCIRPNSTTSPHSGQPSDHHTSAFHSHALPSSHTKSPTKPPDLLPSLREFAARKVLKYSIPIPPYRIPTSLLRYLERGARPCCNCLDPYVREWISCVEVKNYLGHPKVPRSIRFCSTTCMVQTNCATNKTALPSGSSMEFALTRLPNQPTKASIKPFSSLLTQRSNQPSIKSKKPSSQRHAKRTVVTTDW
ncbi:L domain-like protein [Basidiobolus meristosporus CBS 931.73]|uniref:L domain-like protein n=1 Tax=Basidiobolus meristosporus CBS 931.73 TaxID=1314790 RepID=A0A1Y1Y015_9FUNG|nr:L domain-like protein [Basidiobolus meristosporus CBS 931.73]|eukprot:ORX90964.1 L domain-like protein [Basidiobolus meristosporus CBS 931.73]